MFTPADPAEEQDDGLVGAVKRAGEGVLDFLRRKPRANVALANDIGRRAHLGSIAPQLPDTPMAGTMELPAASFELADLERRAAPATWGQTTASLPGRAGAALKKGFADFNAMNQGMRADNLRDAGLADVAAMYPQSPAGMAAAETIADAAREESGAVEAEQWLNAARPVGKESFLQKAIGGAAESSLSNYLPMAAGIATGSIPTALLFQTLGMAPPVVGGTYRQAKKAGLSNDEALRAGVRDLAAEMVGEAAPVGVALRPGMSPLKRIFATAGTEGLEEGVTSPLQSLNAKLSYNPNLTLEEAINDAVLSMASGAIAGGPMGAVGGARAQAQATPTSPTTAYRPTPETAETMARAAEPRDRIQPMIEPALERKTAQPAAPQADRASFLYEPSQGLSDEERAIEQRFAQSIGTDIDRAVANYEKANTQNGTLVINTDQARDLSEDYNRDIESRSLYAAAVHEPASALVKKVWRAALDRPPAPGKEANVIFTAGGTGAGKTTAIDNVPAIAQLRDASDIIYDGNLNNFDKAVQRIEEALASGRTADIVYVYRDPVEAMRNGALPRAERQGRTVRIDAHADSHIGSLKVVGQLMERYKGEPRVNIVVLDNSHGPGGAVETTIDRLPAWEYDALTQELSNVVQADYEAGRISDRVYRGTLGQHAPVTRGTEPRLQEGDPGKPQPQRTRQPEEAAEPVDRALGAGDRTAGLFEEGGHRVASTGRVYGAPPSAKTPQGLKKLRDRLWKLANEGASGKSWYEKTGQAALAAAEGDRDIAEKIVGLLAIYSAGSELRGNTTMAMKAYYEWVKDGHIVTKSRVGQNVADRANAWMANDPDAVTGVKRSTFYENMMRVINPEKYGAETMGATIDMWMARALGYDSTKVGGETQHGRYAFAEREVKRLAKELGWEPQQVQAAIWVAIKARSDEVYTRVRDAAVKKGWLVAKERPNRYGKGAKAYVRANAEGEANFERALLDAALKSETPSASRIADSALDYADTLAERTAQISWEALPSTRSDVLPGIHAAPLEQQAEYLAAIDKALRDEKGQDIIAKMVGLAGANTVFGFSGWEGKVGQGAQTKTFVATDRPPVKDEKTGKNKVGHLVVTEQARSIINLYAAIRGQVMNQDAVAWHFPVFKDSLKDSNGVDVRTNGKLTHDQVQELYNEINKLAGHTDYAPIYTETGVRFLNFKDGMANRDFHDLIEEAYNIVTHLPAAEFGFFRSDGEMIASDSRSSTNGQSYQEIITAAGRSDLQGRIEGLRGKVSTVNASFAEKYGWDKAEGPTATEDRAQGVGEASALYGRNPIDAIEVGKNKADHPGISYTLPGSMSSRRNVSTPETAHRKMLNSAVHDIEAAGFPVEAAMMAVRGVVTYNGNYASWHAAWLPDHRVIGFSEMRLNEMEGSDSRQKYLRGWWAHELTHAIDDAGNGSISSGSPRLDFFVAGEQFVAKGDVVTEVAEAYANGGKIGEFFEYPLAYASQFSPATMKEELLAQLSRLYTTNRELMRRELPVSFEMMEAWYAQTENDSLSATRAGLQAALRTPGPRLGGQERQFHGGDQAVPGADRGVSGVGGAGAGVATGGGAADQRGQGAVGRKRGEVLIQSAYSGNKYAVNLNLDRLKTAGDIKGLIEATAKTITPAGSRGPTATHASTLAAADRLGISEDQVLAAAKKGGTSMTLEQARAYALAVRQLLVTRAEATKYLAAEAVREDATPQDKAEALASLYQLAAIQAVGMNLAAEAGRLLNSYRIMADVTTGDRMTDTSDPSLQATAEQVMENIFGGQKSVDDVLRMVALMSTRQLASGGMRKALLDRRPSAFLEVWKAGLLSGPQTHVVNMVSNALTSAFRIPETALAAAIGKLHGGEKVYAREATALMAGMMHGALKGGADAWQILLHGEEQNAAGKQETHGKAITGENFGLTGTAGKAVDVAGEVVRTPFRALAAEDALFKGINQHGTLWSLAYRQAISEGAKDVGARARQLLANPSKAMLKAAIDDGLYFTYNNKLGQTGQSFMGFLHGTPGGRLAQFLVVPFFRTPTNILKFAAHRSPLAPLTPKFREDFKAGGARRDMAVARMLAGTALATTAFMLASAGLIAGGGEPEKERKATQRMAGWQPYSIKVGDKWVEYRRLEPLGMLLGLSASMAELSKYMSEEEHDHWLKMAGIAFADNITSKTFLSQLSNLIKAIGEPERYGDNYLGAMLGSFVPGAVGQYARARDPVVRDTDPDKNLEGLAYAWDDFSKDLQARIPGQREKLPPKYDALGKPIKTTDAPGYINPFRVSDTSKADPVAKEMAAARARTSPAKDMIRGVRLTPDEKEVYAKASGTVTRARLEALFASPAYQARPTWLKDEEIKKVVDKSRANVRDAIIKGVPTDRRVEAKVRQLRR